MKRIVPKVLILGLFLFTHAAEAQWTPSQRLTWTDSRTELPAIAVDSSGNVYGAWTDWASSNREIFFRKSTNGGSTWMTRQRLTWNDGASYCSTIAADSSGKVHVVWEDRTPGNYEIYYRKSTNGGSTWTNSQRLTWNDGDSQSPVIAVDASGNVHVIWCEYAAGNYEIYYRKSANGGSSWMTRQRLTWNDGYSFFPAIAVDSSGNLHLTWEDDTPGYYEIYYRKSTNEGSSWMTRQRLTWSEGSSEHPAIAVGPSDNLHVVWHDISPGNKEIYYKKSTNAGSTWTDSKRLTWNDGDSSSPAIAIDSFGHVHTVWTDRTSGNPEIYYKKSTNAGSTWSANQRLMWNDGSSLYPDIAVDPLGNVHVVFCNDKPGYYQVYYKRYDE